ncbi:thiolase family protein [Eubacteriaceae bacterium ES2]|nr:thiolase family protein [Eubacteriaceae bacterium ES2]
MNQTKLKPYSRSVSIIGVGCTPFMRVLDDPETEGLTEGELFGYAAIEAMEDAGVTPKDIEFYFHGQANPHNTSDYITPNMQVANWFGMKGKASAHHSEACCTGYHALELAVLAVASGKYDVVLSGAADMGDSLFVEGKPAHFRRKLTMEEFNKSLSSIYDRAYTRSMQAGMYTIFDNTASVYAKSHNLSVDQMDEVLCMMAINNRRNASVTPKALLQNEFDQVAKEFGLADAKAYMKSPFNPKVGEYLRVTGLEERADGAAAVIVCPTEMAFRFKNKPIEVLGTGASSLESSQAHVEWRATIEACRQVYELTGVKPEELDLFYANDFIISSHLAAAELAGYLPEDGWKYVLEGRTAYDGDKPINTNGGRTSFGHAHAASGLADVYEAVMQMRGLCGERQVKKLPKTTMLRGFGGAQNVTATILRTVEEK